MKLYVIPSERCNAHCEYCITNSRKKEYPDFLKLSDLKETLKNFEIEKIEITGGGEPLLHKEIEKITQLCSEKAKTRLYTNAQLLNNYDKLDLNELCVSRAHHNSGINYKIMGVKYDDKLLSKIKTPLKLSLALNKKGINSQKEFCDYLEWAEKTGAYKVVVRELFENEEKEYIKLRNDLFISKNELINSGFLKKINNLTFRYKNIIVEFDENCQCFTDFIILRTDGRIYREW